MVIEATRLEQRLKGADLCITGEGRLDQQSLHGKTAIGVARLCKRLGVPCIAVAGSIDGAVEHEFSACHAIHDAATDVSRAMAMAEELIGDAAAKAFRRFKCGV
jgi:glycerate kinase